MNIDEAQELLDEANEYRDMEQYDNAEQKLREHIKGMPEVPAFWTLLGITLTDLNNWEKSEDAFKKALEYKHDHLTAVLGLGNMYCKKGEPDKAEKCFTKALKVAPDSKLAQDCIEDFRKFGKLTK
jgi:tetratricopeptide (TPR) repeat protein